MAVAFRSVNSAHSGGGVTSFNCPNPAGIVAGDFLVMVVHSWAGSAATPASTGWTLHAHNTSGSESHAVFSKVATGSEGANTTVTFSASAFCNVGIVAYSGGSFDAFSNYGADQTTTTPTVPSVTTTVANDIVVGVVITGFGSGGTVAAGWTERLDHQSSASSGLVYAMERAQAAAGASPTAIVTTSNSYPTRTYAVAIQPAAAPGPTFVPQIIIS